jgi:glucose/arabinose dehydrogenase
VEVVVKGLKIPTSMAFLGPNDILVLEKNTGNVLRIIDGQMSNKPLLHVSPATQFIEWGLLGIAISVIFGHGFGTITDIKVGPDGFLYTLTFDGTIYRIVPALR